MTPKIFLFKYTHSGAFSHTIHPSYFTPDGYSLRLIIIIAAERRRVVTCCLSHISSHNNSRTSTDLTKRLGEESETVPKLIWQRKDKGRSKGVGEQRQALVC
ncbi:unnamed protein product [Cuscuta epithymum]|uniref:Uncharacterized protein n=1 Tax=Cuscuta epithymum TaxID=186058 RepID=A0AAV0FUK5_9ASTE|nr:unnamed protein product [Cuscuta epithymum]